MTVQVETLKLVSCSSATVVEHTYCCSGSVSLFHTLTSLSHLVHEVQVGAFFNQQLRHLRVVFGTCHHQSRPANLQRVAGEDKSIARISAQSSSLHVSLRVSCLALRVGVCLCAYARTRVCVCIHTHLSFSLCMYVYIYIYIGDGG